MADNWWTDDDDDQDEKPVTKADLPESARRHLRNVEKELKALREENAKLQREQRKATVSDIVKAKGYNPSIASFVPNDVEVTDEAVGKWLEAHGELFAKPKTDETGGSAAGATRMENPEGFEIPQELVEALGLVSNVSSGAVTPTKPSDALSKIQNASSPAELIEFLRSQGATV